ncbi:MAG: hypothetical protein Fues2KO_44320 [Fuerstiella sp.]
MLTLCKSMAPVPRVEARFSQVVRSQTVCGLSQKQKRVAVVNATARRNSYSDAADCRIVRQLVKDGFAVGTHSQ